MAVAAAMAVVAGMLAAGAGTLAAEADTLAGCVAVRHFEAVAGSAGVSDFVADSEEATASAGVTVTAVSTATAGPITTGDFTATTVAIAIRSTRIAAMSVGTIMAIRPTPMETRDITLLHRQRRRSYSNLPRLWCANIRLRPKPRRRKSTKIRCTCSR